MTVATPDSGGATSLRLDPLVHQAWTSRWWAGDAALVRIFGSAPSLAALAETARSIPQPEADWIEFLHRPPAAELPPDTLVVLAGQQPVLAGGAALVAHKAATAIQLAASLSEQWDRPVVPVFLLATEDHDSTEVDHIDSIDASNGSLVRARCKIAPGHDAFFRSAWADSNLAGLLASVAGVSDQAKGWLDSIARDERASSSVGWHAAELLHHTFGHLGLLIVESHRLSPNAGGVLLDALTNPQALAEELAAGAARLAEVGLPLSFEPGDPRPLVMESRGGRRRRVGAGGPEAVERLGAHPQDFSPQAALRPLVQASTLPVVAQVCGPSELLYLGQARGLHARHETLRAPVLIPRLEATSVPEGLLQELGGELSAVDLSGAATGPSEEEEQLIQAAERFVSQLEGLDPGVSRRARRWLRGVQTEVRRLAEAPAWSGGGRDRFAQELRPRGRWQDTVLAWLPHALRHDQPRRWAEHIVSLCRPLDPPAHVLHIPPHGET
jgi:uncharacterized protein YllA (UPF0747 family)